MQTLNEIKGMLSQHGVRPSHRLGQNFLHDHNQLRKIIGAADITPGDLILEIGPGTGALTEVLLEAGANIIASEIDSTMATIVSARVGEKIQLIVGDCLTRSRTLSPELLEALGTQPFSVVANLPYSSATPLMMDMLIRRPNCRGQVVLIQNEVADRLLASEGCREYGPISALTALLGKARRVTTVPPGCFWPQPKITSAVIEIIPRNDHGIKNPEALADFLGDVFRTRRKQLGTILGRERIPEEIDPERRPESLAPAELLHLHRHLK
jgi:16S rRNA (adenine1518-N6/adenine1519-N6)-dimethyltransferase